MDETHLSRRVAAGAGGRRVDSGAGHERRPLVILSDNSIDHAIFMLAAMHVGVPAAPVSPAYSLVSKDFDKLKSMIALLDPGAIYVSSATMFAPALNAIASIALGDCRRRRSGRVRRRDCVLVADRGGGNGRCGPRSRPSITTPSQNSCSRRARPGRPRP
jgi:acyl-CoA synthetase (AMP-forming)/AMP-acid ligase II